MLGEIIKRKIANYEHAAFLDRQIIVEEVMEVVEVG